MSRLIDADALKSALAHAVKDYCNRNGPMRTIDFESLIDKAPTIDAIPVEWLKQKYAENDPDGGNEDFDRYLWDSICYVLTAWKEEQEANQ